MRLIALTVASLAIAVAAFSQPSRSFEVASVRPSAAPGITVSRIQSLPNGQLNATATLRDLIRWAYALAPYQRVEGEFLELDRWFRIAAKASGNVTPRVPGEIGPYNLMLQSLLADRFRLKVGWSTSLQTVQLLRRTRSDALARGMTALDVDCSPVDGASPPRPCGTEVPIINGQLNARVRSMADFARVLSTMSGRAIVDDTGLIGRFELKMTFDPSTFIPTPSSSSPITATLPAFLDALRDDLGLRLEPARRDVPVLVVEHAELPSEN